MVTKRVLGIVIVLVLLVASSVPFFVNTSPVAAETGNPYLVRTFIDDDGNEIAMYIDPGRPPEVKMAAVEVPEPNIEMGINTLSDVPAFDWCYGCSATSAAMMCGYYDRTGYSNMYAGPTNGGVCPLDNTSWGSGECPLSATHQGYDGLATRGHVDDYWSSYGSSVDPYYGNWTEHGYADCTADFMGTNQYHNWLNVDGSTTFYYYTNGAPDCDYSGSEPTYRDGCHGLRLFIESRGYSVTANCNQLIYGYNGNTLGFTFADYMAEIDAGRPVLIHVEGHTMLGFGYNTSGNLVYLHDTWDHSSHTMTWGGEYSGLPHYAVTYIRLAALTPPTITTEGYTQLTDTSVRMLGTLNDLGTASSVRVTFFYGTTTDCADGGSSTKTLSGTNYFGIPVSGLTPATTYYFKARAIGDGTSYGDVMSFTTTGATPPTVTTEGYTQLTDTSVRMLGTLNDLGTASSVRAAFFYGTTTDCADGSSSTKTLSGTNYFGIPVSGLTPATLYYFKVRAIGDGTSYGDVLSFTTTGATPPTVTTEGYTQLTDTSVRLLGTLNDLGSASSVRVAFFYGTTTDCADGSSSTKTLSGTNYFGIPVSGLTPATTYYFKVRAIGDGTSYGGVMSFTTSGATPPTVTTEGYTQLTDTSVRLLGTLNDLGSASSVRVAFFYGTTTDCADGSSSTKTLSGTNYFGIPVSGLTPGTLYYFKVRAIGDGTSYGDVMSFTTSS